MNKYICTVALCVALMASCGGNEGQVATIGHGKQLAFEKFTYSKVTPISKVDGSPTCDVDISVHFMAENDSIASKVNDEIGKKLFDIQNSSMQEAVETFAEKYTKDYLNTFSRFFRADSEREDRWANYEFRYKISTEVAAGPRDITTYTAKVYFYEGGAHGIEQFFTFNFDARTGELLDLDDVFKTGYESALSELLFTALEKKAGVKGLIKLQEKGYLCTTDIYVPDNFLLEDDRITFIFNVYEIAPYSMGRTLLSIKYDEIGDLLSAWN